MLTAILITTILQTLILSGIATNITNITNHQNAARKPRPQNPNHN